MKIKNVFIVGGTHGNEWTGAYIILKYQQKIKEEFPQLNFDFEIGNPDAFRLNKRFIDFDLNRIFNNSKMIKKTRESKRAKILEKKIIRFSPCLIIDLHTTTANMGDTLILTVKNKFNYSLVSKIKGVKIVISKDQAKNHLVSQSPYGIIIEVGPVHQNVIDLNAINRTLNLIRKICEALISDTKTKNNYLNIFEEILEVKYPENDSGQIEAALHENFIGKDFSKQNETFTPFRKFTGEEISMKINEHLFPIFINESSYYVERLAFILCKKRTIVVRCASKDASRG